MDYKKITGQLDIIIPKAIIIFSFPILLFFTLFSQGVIYFLTIGLVIISCIIWLRMQGKIVLNKNNYLNKAHGFSVLVISCVILSALSILVIYYRSDLYQRPLIYFVIHSIIVGALSLQIFHRLSKKYTYLILIEIILLGYSLEFVQQMLFPGVLGIDPWWHQMFVNKIINNGNIPDNYDYSKMPSFHLLIANASIIVNMDYKLTTTLTIGLVHILCNTLIMFCFGKHLIDERVGLLSSLLLINCNYFVNMGVWASPTTLAAVFFIKILYVLLRLRGTLRFSSSIYVICLMVALIITHTIISVAMMISLLLAYVLLSLNRNRVVMPPISILNVVIFIVGMLGWWMYASGHIAHLGFLIKWGFSERQVATLPKEIAEYISTVPIYEQLIGNLGIFLYFAISLVGLFFMISRGYDKSYSLVYACISALPLIIVYFAPIVGRYVIVNRWSFIAQMLLSVPVAASIFLFYHYMKNNIIRNIALTGLTLIISFFMIISTQANVDNHIFFKNTGVRYAVKKSEITGAYFFVNRSNGKISSDFDFSTNNSSSIFVNYFGMDRDKISSLDKSLQTGHFVPDDSIKVIRNEIINRPFRLGGGIYRIQYDFDEMLIRARLCKIYDNYAVYGYL